MTKSIKDTFIENMIMNQHEEKIKKVQELMIEKIKKSKQYIEQSIVREVSNNNNTEALIEYKLRLTDVDELLHKVRYDFLNVDLDTIMIEVVWDSKKEYEELVEVLKQPYKQMSFDNANELKVNLNKELDDAMDAATDWFKLLGEAMKKNKAGW